MSEAELVQEEAYDPRHSGFLLNVNLVFISSFGVNVLSFAIVVVVARLLGPHGKGITSLYQTGLNASYAFISFGVSLGALYFVSRREVTPRQAMESGLTATVLSALLAATGAGVLGLTLGDKLAGAGVPYWMIVIALPLVVQFRIVEVLLRADARFLVVSLIEALLPASTLAGMVAVELVRGLTVSSAIVIWSLSPLPSLVIGYWCLGRSAIPRRLGIGEDTMKLVKFGLQGTLGNIVQLLNYRLDSYLVLLFVNAGAVGLYSVGVSLSEGLWLLANSISVVLIPKLAASDADYASRTAPLICRNTVLVTGLGALALAAASPIAVPLLFGKSFHGAIAPLLWLLPGIVALAGTKVLAAYVFSQGKPLINTWVSMVTLAITLGGDLVLIPLFEVPGAAIASTLAYIVSFALTLRAYSKLSGRPFSEALVPRGSDIALFVEGVRTAMSRLKRRSPPGAEATIRSGN